MLCELKVRNFVLIEELTLAFESGFTVLSGETGAGKSILVGALGLIIGGRGDADLIRTGSLEAVVEAVFDIRDHQELSEVLRETGLFEGEDLIIRRHLSAQGRSKILINGHLVTLAQLESFTSLLLDLSGQHDQQKLLHEENHLLILDAEPSLEVLKKSYQDLYASTQKLKSDIHALKAKNATRDQRIDFLKFQLKEIKEAALNDEHEEEKLLEEKGRAKNADFLFALSKDGCDLISESEGNMLAGLDSLVARFQKGASFDPALAEGLESLERARVSLDEAGLFLSRYREKISVDPERLDAIESRLYHIHRLKKKFGGTLADVLKQESAFISELKELEDYEDSLAGKEKELNELVKTLLEKAHALSLARKKRAKMLEQKIQKELVVLSMPQVGFRIVVESPSSPDVLSCMETGMDTVRFEMAPNQGEGFKAIAKIASGGELSRILLALKQVLHADGEKLTMIFDEVDTGIGGAVADVVGLKLKTLSKNNQVICVTHLPQVAAYADHHYIIAKGVVDKRTQTSVQRLDQTGRESELARMLGGKTVSDKARDHARELLKMAQGLK